MALDCPIRTDLILSPPERSLHLLVALFNPHAQTIHPHNLVHAGCLQACRRCALTAGKRKIADQLPGTRVRKGRRIGGDDDGAMLFGWPIRPSRSFECLPDFRVSIPKGTGDRTPRPGLLGTLPACGSGNLRQ